MQAKQVLIWLIWEWSPSVCPCNSKTPTRVEIVQNTVLTQSWWHHRTIDWHQWSFTMATMNRVRLQQPLKLLCLTMEIVRICPKTKELWNRITNFQPYSIAHKASIKPLSKKWSQKTAITAANLSSKLWTTSQAVLSRVRQRMAQQVQWIPRNELWPMKKAKKIRPFTPNKVLWSQMMIRT